ncbi:hypothetical protein Arub01_24600 [Actinomadura rubrobrunea]|uniref:Uncharacterized protein n=1 Tax=Actinomadura rubrobrunea TaxID=115335 RepID=A0A9W6UU20_9ACTN|nr:hypothetical protein Arub01_24600 [Actinomadura rubrobrunea]
MYRIGMPTKTTISSITPTMIARMRYRLMAASTVHTFLSGARPGGAGPRVLRRNAAARAARIGTGAPRGS